MPRWLHHPRKDLPARNPSQRPRLSPACQRASALNLTLTTRQSVRSCKERTSELRACTRTAYTRLIMGDRQCQVRCGHVLCIGQISAMSAQPSHMPKRVYWVSLDDNYAFARGTRARLARNGDGMTYTPQRLELGYDEAGPRSPTLQVRSPSSSRGPPHTTSLHLTTLYVVHHRTCFRPGIVPRITRHAVLRFGQNCLTSAFLFSFVFVSFFLRSLGLGAGSAVGRSSFIHHHEHTSIIATTTRNHRKH